MLTGELETGVTSARWRRSGEIGASGNSWRPRGRLAELVPVTDFPCTLVLAPTWITGYVGYGTCRCIQFVGLKNSRTFLKSLKTDSHIIECTDNWLLK